MNGEFLWKMLVEHMQKRRLKPSADAAASGDKPAAEAWKDESKTSNEQVRQEVLRVHLEYLPILQKLDRRQRSPAEMVGLTPQELVRLERARSWASTTSP